MLEVGRAIVSFDVLKEHFICDLLKCKGACCVEGDSGAPLTEAEAIKLEEIYPTVSELLSEEHKKSIREQGMSHIDNDGDLVTTLVGNRECVFTIPDKNGIMKCALEKAYLEGKTDFRKPLSCHLFPIRITEYKHFDAVNYEKLDICKPGRLCGASVQLPLYKFLKEPLIRKYGEEWYDQLEIADEHLNKSGKAV